MDVIDFVSGYGAWAWVIGGLVLLALELVAPGGVLVWLGAAAVATGLLTIVSGYNWPLNGIMAHWAVQWLVFGVLSVAGIFGWLRYKRSRPEATDKPMLNRGAERYVGQEPVLTEPVVGGFGRVALGDGFWRVKGPDLAAGRRVRVSGYDGAVLLIEPVDEVPPGP